MWDGKEPVKGSGSGLSGEYFEVNSDVNLDSVWPREGDTPGV